MKDQYADFARDYDWLYSDRQQVGDRQLRGAASRLDAVDRPRVLDCACGTGMFALALARHGYDAVGTDASPAMIAQAANHADREGVSILLSACPWSDLPRRFDPEFDFVFCCGNSIGHCRDEAEMVASLAAMRAVLRPGGSLILETRDWEALLSARERFTCFGPRERDGRRCVPWYVWNFPDEPTEPVVVEVVLPIEADGSVTLHSYPIVYHPFTLSELTHRFRKAGFADVETASTGGGSIQVVGRVV